MSEVISKYKPIWLVIPCAGSGTRFGAHMPKQYLPLLDQCVLQQTLARFLQRDDIKGIVIVHAKNDQWLCELPEIQQAKSLNIFMVEGGVERADSVLNGLRFIQSLANYACDDWVAVHDAARPCVSQESLNALFSERSQTGAILASAVVETVKHVDGAVIEETIDRDKVFLAQTPQIFPLSNLLEAFKKANKASVLLTDEASAMEFMGCKPQIVLGDRSNLKITQSDDLALAEFHLQRLLAKENNL